MATKWPLWRRISEADIQKLIEEITPSGTNLCTVSGRPEAQNEPKSGAQRHNLLLSYRRTV